MIDVVQQVSTALVTLRRPPANAMNLELLEEIAAVFQRLGLDRSVRSVVLTGRGKSFCAGVDLKALPGFDEIYQRRMVDALNRAFYAVYSCPVPVVGAINGHAIAGELVLALCCDWRIAVKAQFLAGLAEVRVGVPYPVAAMEVARQELRADVKAWGSQGPRIVRRFDACRTPAPIGPDPIDFGIRLNRGRMLWPAPRAKALLRARLARQMRA